MDTIELDEDFTADERRRARPFAIEALRSLGVALSEDDRDAWLETLVGAVVRGARAQSILDLEQEARAMLDRRTAVKPGLRPARPQWIDIPFRSGDTITAEGAEELRLFALALEEERRCYLTDGCTAVTKTWLAANEKRIADLTDRARAGLASTKADAIDRLSVATRSMQNQGHLAPTTDKGAPVKPTADEEPVAGSGSAGAPPARVLGLRPVFVHLNDLRELKAGSSPIVLAHAAMRECMRQIVEFNEDRDDVTQPHAAIRLPDPIPEPDEDTCVSSAEEIEDHGYNQALEDVRTKLADQGFHVAP